MSEFPPILVVEDDQSIQDMVEEALADGGFGPALADSGEEAVTLLKGGNDKYRAKDSGARKGIRAAMKDLRHSLMRSGLRDPADRPRFG